MPDVSILNVNLYGETIGTLTYVSATSGRSLPSPTHTSRTRSARP